MQSYLVAISAWLGKKNAIVCPILLLQEIQ